MDGDDIVAFFLQGSGVWFEEQCSSAGNGANRMKIGIVKK